MASSWGKLPITYLKIFNLELFLSNRKIETKNGAETEGRAIQRQGSWDPSHQQTSNPYTIVDDKMCLHRGAWYGYPLRSSASTFLRQLQTLTGNHWTEPKDPVLYNTWTSGSITISDLKLYYIGYCNENCMVLAGKQIGWSMEYNWRPRNKSTQLSSMDTRVFREWKRDIGNHLYQMVSV